MQIARMLVPLLFLAGCATAPDPIVREATYARSPAPAYPALARRQGVEGVVEVSVHVLASGLPGGVEILKSSGNALLDASAVESVKRAEFVPARTASGRSVESWIRAPIRFVLRGSRSTENAPAGARSDYDASVP